MNLGESFGAAIAEAERALAIVTESQAGHSGRPAGWLRKEELGHLLDSAQNNHQRIVLAALNGSYTGPVYEQNAWVDLHGYRDLPWSELLAQWKARNAMLRHIIARIPEARLHAPVTIGQNAAMPLQAWIEDYVQHLAHHVAQITSGLQ